MAEAHEVLNGLPPAEARAALLRCCGSGRWADEMLRRRPYASAAALHADADAVWSALGQDDFLEAFAHHPAIGGGGGAAAASDGGALAATRAWSAEEQAGVAGAAADTALALRAANHAYRQR